MPDQTQQFSFKVLTINIHKGFTAFNRRFILPELRDAVRTVSADIVCLQEVMGAHEVHPLHVENWPDTSHYEFLADTMWSDFAYGRNAVYPEGHHGNAVLSRYPIEHYENRDVSVDGAEKRGVLYCRIVPPMTGKAIHVMCVHLGLREAHRQAQLAVLAEWVNELPDGEPDMPIVRVGARLLYNYLVKGGVQVFEYRRRPLHGKVALMDDHWATVGSSNLDPLSLSLNLEANVIIHDRNFNQTLRDNLNGIIAADCQQVDETMLPKRTWWNLTKSVLAFHFLRHFPALVGWLPAHTPRLAQVDPPAQPTMETQDRVETENTGVKP